MKCEDVKKKGKENKRGNHTYLIGVVHNSYDITPSK